jgi:hypothetical protein
MKNNRIVCLAALLMASFSAAQAQFTAGNLVVLQDGDGIEPLASSGNEIFLDQFTTSGTFVNSLAIPTNGASALLDSGTAASEGALTLSANGQYLVFAGYNANYPYSSSLPSSASTAVARAVATVDASGHYTLAATTSSQFSANNIRSGTTDGNGNFWAVGANSGVVYLGTGTPAAVSTTSANNRVIQAIGGNLYFSTGSGSTRGVYQVTGTPTSGANTAVSFINTSTLGSTSPYDFVFNSIMNLCYIADSDAYTTSAGFGGIEKWALVGGVWTFQYSLPTVGVGANGLAVNFSGVNPIIYATSGDGTNLFSIVDTGASATASLLDTASPNEAFRGLSFAPGVVPEPSTLALAGSGLLALWKLRRQRKP